MKFLYVGDHAETLETGRPIAPWELYDEEEPSETTLRWISEGKARPHDEVAKGDTNLAEIKDDPEPPAVDETSSNTGVSTKKKKGARD